MQQPIPNKQSIKAVDIDFLQNLKEKKVLVYASSSRFRKEYLDLPFDYIVLSNYEYFRKSGMRLIGNKVIELPWDNNKTLRVFKNLGLKVQCFVGIQDGCSEGGNYECVNSYSFFGRLSPILEDKALYITNHWDGLNMQSVTNIVSTYGFMNTHYEKMATSYELPHIDLLTRFCEHESDDERKMIIPIQRKQPNTVEARASKITLAVSHASVWEHESEFDCIVHSPFSRRGLDSINPFLDDKRVKELRLIDDYKNNPALLLEDAYKNKWKTIGLVPFMAGKYDDFVDLCMSWDKPYPEKIHFFHLEDRDLGQLRLGLGSLKVRNAKPRA